VSVLDWVTVGLMLAGAIFFLAGTLGLLRFPDAHARLHALTKADNLGLGLLVAGLSFQAESSAVVARMVLLWLVVLLSSATTAYLIGGSALENGSDPEADDA
jgi:multicomponent Na+:H+ antiporter subunit G